MSADEIRKLAGQVKNDGGELHEFTVVHDMSHRLEGYAAALLAYADMVERCEKLKLNMIPHKHDKEIVDYILEGANDGK